MKPGADDAVVVGAVVANLRELLLERGQWRDLRRVADDAMGSKLSELDEVHGTQWVRLDHYAALLDALGSIYPDDRIHELGVSWLERALERGFLANMIRSWLRSFAHTPDNVTLLVPHLWVVVYRNAGRMSVAGRGDGFLRMRVEPAPEVLVSCAAWHRLLEGVGDALFAIAEVDSAVQIGPAPARKDAVDFLVLAG
ncbi:MAG: hypothetical protein GXP55_08825 [Deltaproteobacteria bacterium]|nr:hypothetical protein [Deltaproteobacteria bacterium]